MCTREGMAARESGRLPGAGHVIYQRPRQTGIGIVSEDQESWEDWRKMCCGVEKVHSGSVYKTD